MSRFLLILAFLAFCAPAAAADKVLHDEVFLENCGATGGAIDTNLACGGASGLPTVGMNSLSFWFDFTRSAATGWTCDLEYFSAKMNKWAKGTTQAPASGQIVLNPARISRTISASEVLFYSININADAVRLQCIGAGAPTASDKLAVVARRTFSPDM